MHNRHIYIICGHYGSGKSEIAANLALRLKETQGDCALIDIDVVNPYFRTRQLASYLNAHGVTVISNNFSNDWRIDQPALSAEINQLLLSDMCSIVIDIGGNATGALVLSCFSDLLAEQKYEMLFVLNANRPNTESALQNVELVKEIERTSGLKITGLVNNTHMLYQTSEADVLKGAAVCRELTALTGIPLVHTCITGNICNGVDGMDSIMRIELLLRPKYLKP